RMFHALPNIFSSSPSQGSTPETVNKIFIDQEFPGLDLNFAGMPPLQVLQKGDVLPASTCAMSFDTFCDCVTALKTREALAEELKAQNKLLEDLLRKSSSEDSAAAASLSQPAGLSRKYVKAQTLEDLIASDPSVLNGEPISEPFK